MQNTFINEELNYIKNFMGTMRKNRYRKGDTFVAQDLVVNEYYSESGSVCCAMVRRGILSIDGVKYFKIGDNNSRREVTAQDILEGKVKGMFCSVNVYKVECDNMREYINEITNEFLD